MAITTIQFKRGSKKAWNVLNLVLEAGEPGFEKDTSRFKIGDGKTPWNDLPYQDQANNSIYSADTLKDFPVDGDENIIYKATLESKLYQWNSEEKNYQQLYADNLDNIFKNVEVIYGGNASGNY